MCRPEDVGERDGDPSRPGEDREKPRGQDASTRHAVDEALRVLLPCFDRLQTLAVLSLLVDELLELLDDDVDLSLKLPCVVRAQNALLSLGNKKALQRGPCEKVFVGITTQSPELPKQFYWTFQGNF